MVSLSQPSSETDGEETWAPVGGGAETLCGQALLSAYAKRDEAVEAKGTLSDWFQSSANGRSQ